MSLSRLLMLCAFVILGAPVWSAEPAPKAVSEPFPIVPQSHGNSPAAAAEQPLPRGDTGLRPVTKPSLLPDDVPSATWPPMEFVPTPLRRESVTLQPVPKVSDLELRIRYQKARNAAETNEGVRAAWNDSRTARTEEGKRKALRRYQDLLFAKMLSTDRGIASLVEQRRKALKPMLEQTHLTPTIPIE